jgi:hypothetical protein
MVFNNEIQLLKGKKMVVYITKKHLKLNFKILHLDKISIRYQISEMMFCVMF